MPETNPSTQHTKATAKALSQELIRVTYMTP